jgi:cob(I)alamin adenosyltransferase
MKTGLTQLYIGKGKGKTTAALGQSIRALGRGMQILLIQFFKGADTGELSVLEGIREITVRRFHSQGKFFWKMKENEKIRLEDETREGLSYALDALTSGSWDMIVLDEILNAQSAGFITEDELLALIAANPGHTEVVMTGRETTDAVIKAADLVSKVEKIKHPYDRGIKARKGIEF